MDDRLEPECCGALSLSKSTERMLLEDALRTLVSLAKTPSLPFTTASALCPLPIDKDGLMTLLLVVALIDKDLREEKRAD